MTTIRLILNWILFLTAGIGFAIGAEDRVIEDFEGTDFGSWKVEGEAFGKGPMRGEMRGQIAPSGFIGGRANSYHGGIASTGKIISPKFLIDRNYLNFLIGGGEAPGKVGVRLIVDGKVLREATGSNDRTMWMQRLDWISWNVSDLKGREAVLEVFDESTSAQAIMVDHFVLSDRDYTKERVSKKMRIKKEWMHVPVKLGARQCLIRLREDGKLLREFEVELAENCKDVDFWTAEHMREFKGREIEIEIDRLPNGERGLDVFSQSDEYPGMAEMYKEKYRPQFHFSARRGRMLDPNGLVYYNGEYHIFFQHFYFALNRTAIRSWGHAVSRDLIHWEELPAAIYTDHLGTIFSGCAVVDTYNSSGLQEGEEKVIACIYTSSSGASPWSRGQRTSQSMAYSVDGGRTWKKYEKNPIVPNIYGGNRDPKVIWHEPTKQWIMSLFFKNDGTYLLLGSKNLLDWEQLSKIKLPGVIENPDFFELPLDGNANEKRWVFSANGFYYVGQFDGKSFTPEGKLQSTPRGTYAEQTFSNLPDAHRQVQMAYILGGRFPGMPFWTQMTAPRELSLKTTSAGILMCAEPVRELAQLRGRKWEWKNERIAEGGSLSLLGVEGDCFDVVARISGGFVSQFGKVEISHDPATRQLVVNGHAVELLPEMKEVSLRVLIDRTSLEVFVDGGTRFFAVDVLTAPGGGRASFTAKSGGAEVKSLEIYRMKSIWKRGGTK